MVSNPCRDSLTSWGLRCALPAAALGVDTRLPDEPDSWPCALPMPVRSCATPTANRKRTFTNCQHATAWHGCARGRGGRGRRDSAAERVGVYFRSLIPQKSEELQPGKIWGVPTWNYL